VALTKSTACGPIVLTPYGWNETALPFIKEPSARRSYRVMVGVSPSPMAKKPTPFSA
jgi:hypothetical protein